MGNLEKPNLQRQSPKAETGEGAGGSAGSRLQTPGYKINEFWGPHGQRVIVANKTALYT